MLPSFIFITMLFYVSNVSTEVSKQEFQNIMLHSLNDARKKLQDKAKIMPPLTWDTTLANDAERFAKKCYPTKKVDESHRHFGQTSALVFSHNLKADEVKKVAKNLVDEKDFDCHHKCLLYKTWDSTLANDAEEFATKCQYGIDLDHRHLGQNFATVFTPVLELNGAMLATNAAREWLDQKDLATDYSTLKSACNYKCLKYTQVIWANTRQVGCGFANCHHKMLGYMVVCFYEPQGNLFNTYPYVEKTGR